LLGGSESELDLDELRRAVVYEGGYHWAHPTIQTFWAAVTSFSDEERKSLIKFITSCSRAPLLGFTSLQPKICIVMSGGVLDSRSIERLPTAATCMNLLKLPPYPTVSMMRDKLLLAITSGAGFDLS
jgi:ubiquitin-protein ligase E3 C